MGEVVKLRTNQEKRERRERLAAAMQYEEAYDRYIAAVQRYLKSTGNTHLMRHYIPPVAREEK